MSKIKELFKNRILKAILVIIIISILVELVLLLYNIFLNKLFSKLHFTGNETIVIAKDNTDILLEEDTCLIKISGLADSKIYNISLDLKEKNQDVYMRVLFNNDAKLMPKENKDATRFKVYFLNGLQTNEFKIAFAKDTIDLDNLEKVEINSNIDYLPNMNFSIIRVSVLFIVLFVIYLFIYLFIKLKNKQIKLKPENIFLILSLFLGLVFVFINLPQVRYDEHAHLWRSYELSEGHLVSDPKNGLPTNLINLYRNSDGSYPNRNMTYDLIKQQMDVELEKDKTENMSVGVTGSLTPISYIPQTIGTFIGRVLNLKPIIILWLARSCNLIAYSVLIYLAIKIMPSKKLKAIWMIIGLFPMGLNLAASLSPDAVIVSWTLMAISYTLKLKYEDEKVTSKKVILLSIMYMIPAICKIVYIPLILMFLMIPKEKFSKPKSKIIYFIVCILITIVPYLALNKIVKTGTYDIAIRSNGFENLLFTITDPIRTVGTMIKSINLDISTWLFEMIGGWNTIDIISIIIFVILLSVVYMKVEDEEKYKLDKKDNIILAIISIIEIIGVIAAMYIGWTQPKETIMDGVQGRYFLPTIPLLLMIMKKNKMELKLRNKYAKFSLIMIILYLCIFLNTIFIQL